MQCQGPLFHWSNKILTVHSILLSKPFQERAYKIWKITHSWEKSHPTFTVREHISMEAYQNVQLGLGKTALNLTPPVAWVRLSLHIARQGGVWIGKYQPKLLLDWDEGSSNLTHFFSTILLNQPTPNMIPFFSSNLPLPTVACSIFTEGIFPIYSNQL